MIKIQINTIEAVTMNMAPSLTEGDRVSITENDRVVVRGRYLVYEKEPSRRFHTRGIAFPVPLPSRGRRSDQYDDREGWFAVMQQLRDSSPYINTLRLYQLPIFKPMEASSMATNISQSLLTTFVNEDESNGKNPAIHPRSIQEFVDKARELGFYVLLPFTSTSGDGVLDRSMEAPTCYSPELFRYGTKLIDALTIPNNGDSVGPSISPNLLGGILGNEVMNSLAHWKAAPCVLAYARDLKLYMYDKFGRPVDPLMEEESTSNRHHHRQRGQIPPLPLIYATQHDGIGAAVTPAQNLQNMLEYLTCSRGRDDEAGTVVGIDMYGINIESWCSSLQTFSRSEDGAVGTYWELFHDLKNVSSVPIIFSEMGCSRALFDRDNGLPSKGVRDWKQISVVEHKMNDVLSGFVAYTYDGSPGFRMTTDGPWNGHDVLPFDKDFYNFISQLNKTSLRSLLSPNLSMVEKKYQLSPNCTLVVERLSHSCNLELFPVDDIPSYFLPGSTDKQTNISLPNEQTQSDTTLTRPGRRRRNSSKSRGSYFEDQDSFNVVFSDQVVHPIRFPRSLATASLVLALFVLRRRPVRQRQYYLSLSSGTERRLDYNTFV